MPAIVLSTLNARYIHSAFGLRYLKANLEELAPACELREFTIHERPIDIAEKLLQYRPAIIGLGVYIWNVEEITRLVALLKQISPQTLIVLGGPEVSYEAEQQELCRLSDYVIAGPGDVAFRDLCRQLLGGTAPPRKYIPQQVPTLSEVRFPYHLYTDEDIAQRIIYVEASRGCPFKCEFCLSALDRSAWPFDLEQFLAQMERLYNRGARHFKFVDRTFNLKIDHSIRILEFFLERMDAELFLHFELIPDHLPDRLKAIIARFPENSLQFEVGVQTFNPDTQALISRRQNDEKTEANLTWLRQHSQAHIHSDLIVGLPGEDMESFAQGFNRLVRLEPHEIQVGILKRLRGSPIARHGEAYQMRFNPYPPYNILSNSTIDFNDMQRLTRFARYWDMVINSGRFNHSRSLILGDHPFERFLQLSDWLYEATGQTHRIALQRLFELLYTALTQCLACNAQAAMRSLTQDYTCSGLKGSPRFLQGHGRDDGLVKASARRRQLRH